MEIGSKRKRDLGCPRITFHASDRTFDRLLRGNLFPRSFVLMVDMSDSEDSLEDLKSAVRTKLGFGEDAKITLSQMRSGSDVVLEDGKS